MNKGLWIGVGLFGIILIVSVVVFGMGFYENATYSFDHHVNVMKNEDTDFGNEEISNAALMSNIDNYKNQIIFNIANMIISVFTLITTIIYTFYLTDKSERKRVLQENRPYLSICMKRTEYNNIQTSISNDGNNTATSICIYTKTERIPICQTLKKGCEILDTDYIALIKESSFIHDKIIISFDDIFGVSYTQDFEWYNNKERVNGRMLRATIPKEINVKRLPSIK